MLPQNQLQLARSANASQQSSAQKSSQIEAENAQLKVQMVQLQNELEKAKRAAAEISSSVQGSATQLAAENEALKDSLELKEKEQIS